MALQDDNRRNGILQSGEAANDPGATPDVTATDEDLIERSLTRHNLSSNDGCGQRAGDGSGHSGLHPAVPPTQTGTENLLTAAIEKRTQAHVTVIEARDRQGGSGSEIRLDANDVDAGNRQGGKQLRALLLTRTGRQDGVHMVRRDMTHALREIS